MGTLIRESDLILVAEGHFHHKLRREPKIFVCNNFHNLEEISESREN